MNGDYHSGIDEANDNEVKYMVKTDLFPGCWVGDEIIVKDGKVRHPSGYGILPCLTLEILDKNEQWFEKLPEYEEGDWMVSNYGSIVRIDDLNSTYGDKYVRGYGFDNSNGVSGEWGELNIRPERPATPEEVKAALVEEAKRRGFPVKSWRGPKSCTEYLNSMLKDQWSYYENSDRLENVGGIVYEKGKWAEIIEEDPIVINGHEVDIPEEEYLYIEVGCKKVPRSVFGMLRDCSTSYDLSIHRKGEDITGQILKIAKRI